MEKFIDLGLPSGTLWADRNFGASSPKDDGVYVEYTKIPKHTPTIEQFKELLANCSVSKTNEVFSEWRGRKYLTECDWVLTSKKNGASILIPSAGWKQVGDPNKHSWRELSILWTTNPQFVAITQANTAKVVGQGFQVPFGWEGMRVVTAYPTGWLHNVRRCK